MFISISSNKLGCNFCAINILDVCGLQCASFGNWTINDDVTEVINANRPTYRKLIWNGTIISGAIILGQADDVALLNDMGMIKGLIQAKVFPSQPHKWRSDCWNSR